MSEFTGQPKNDQNAWSIIFTLLYALSFALGLIILKEVRGSLPTSISLFDLVLVILAAFRLTRLFVYDHITQFFRDFFLDTEEYVDARGAVMVRRLPPLRGPRRTVHELLECAWCFGMWAGLLVPFFYFLTPYAWLIILILAVSGVATFVQLWANLIGWKAEYKKQKTQAEYGKDGQITGGHCGL